MIRNWQDGSEPNVENSLTEYLNYQMEILELLILGENN